jgi:hypothetical protein
MDDILYPRNHTPEQPAKVVIDIWRFAAASQVRCTTENVTDPVRLSGKSSFEHDHSGLKMGERRRHGEVVAFKRRKAAHQSAG